MNIKPKNKGGGIEVYSPKEMATVSHLSALLFTKKEIEILMDDAYVVDFETAQTKGKLQGEYELRKSLYTKAKDGDTGAMSQWNILKATLKN